VINGAHLTTDRFVGIVLSVVDVEIQAKLDMFMIPQCRKRVYCIPEMIANTKPIAAIDIDVFQETGIGKEKSNTTLKCAKDGQIVRVGVLGR